MDAAQFDDTIYSDVGGVFRGVYLHWMRYCRRLSEQIGPLPPAD